MASLPHDIAMIAENVRGIRGSQLDTTGDLLSDSARYTQEGNTRSGDRIRLALIDSDPVATSAIRARLLAHHDFEVIAEVSSAQDALRRISVLQPEAVLVDVATWEASHLDCAGLLSQPVNPIVVFLTTNKHYAVKAFDLGAADCLVKPLRDDRFEITLNRLREQVSHRRVVERVVERGTTASAETSISRSIPSKRIAVTDRGRTHVIEASEIDWISAAGDYAELHVRGVSHLLREPLSLLMSRLPANVFCRIHRSFVVNLSRVSAFKTLRNQDLLVRLKDKTVLRASRTFSDGLRKAIMQQCV